MDDPPCLLVAAAWAGAHALQLFFVGLALLLIGAWGLGRWLHSGTQRSVDSARPPLPRQLSMRLAIGFALVLACAALFSEIAQQLHAAPLLGEADAAFAAALAASQLPDAVFHGFHLVTFAGERSSLTGLAVFVAGLLWLRGRRAWALGWVLGMAGNGLLNPALKGVFERTRPEHPGAWLSAEGFSFPSGHSSGSVVAFGLLAYLALRLLAPRWHLPTLLAAVGLAFSVGASRVFLGVHHASDVLAGFASGLAWLLVCVNSLELARWVRRRQRSGRPDPAAGS